MRAQEPRLCLSYRPFLWGSSPAEHGREERGARHGARSQAPGAPEPQPLPSTLFGRSHRPRAILGPILYRAPHARLMERLENDHGPDERTRSEESRQYQIAAEGPSPPEGSRAA